MIKPVYLVLSALACLGLGCAAADRYSAQEWTVLLDRELSQWETYLSYAHKQGYDGSVPRDSSGNEIEPIGVLDDPQDHGVFTIVEDSSPPMLRISGEIYGGLTTKSEYRNFHMKLRYKWGEKVFEPREKLLKDTGLLYYAVGEHGKDYWRSWMVSQEFQIMRGHVGDYWTIGNTAVDGRAFTPEYIMNPVADETQPFISVGTGESQLGFILRKENRENPEGEWNELELFSYEGKSLHIVNGDVVMVLKNSRIVNEATGAVTPMLEGKIQIQSEAAEVYFKNIYIREISELPEHYAKLFDTNDS